MPLLRSKSRKKHMCYYGYARTPWYRVSCPICEKVVTSNLPVLIFAGVLLIAFILAAFMILLKF